MRALVVAAPLLFCAMSSASVKVSNVIPRTTADGALMDAHDGNTVQFTPGGPYFWCAAKPCCPFLRCLLQLSATDSAAGGR
jgi:hypothetical protein